MAKHGLWMGVLGAGLLGLAACGGSSSGSSSVDGGAATGGGGTGGTGGGGTGGFVNSMADKIDLLFMVDNSISMADKQEILAQAVPPLVNRLIAPATDPATGKPEFKPIVDIHIGVISSSLGGHGGDQCSKSNPYSSPQQYDNAHLIGTVRPDANLASYQSLGFLWWDPTAQGSPPGEANADALVSNFAAHVKATGEKGCGFEASLEAWYRFLIDPNPPDDVVVNNNVAEITGVDSVVLQQRKDFLRPDSLVAIVMLSDENDCSTVDGGVNWIASQLTSPSKQAFHLPRATSACASDPNGPCCRSCASAEGVPPTGCQSLGSDPECMKGAHDDVGDHPNLRCWDQKRRFGLDFLYPTRRYVEGLTQPLICPVWDASGPVGCDMNSRVANPLFISPTGEVVRSPGLVFFATIVGVPWQDIATEASLSGPGLEYLTATELAAKGRWDWLTPQCKQQVTDPLPRPLPSLCQTWDYTDQPDDALMVESSSPRTGTALGINQPVQPPDAAAMANPINGHEWNTDDADLQYACIFRLSTPKSCAAPAPIGCDCDDVTSSYTANNPLCQSGTGYSTMQQYAKAFPGTRHLEVARGFGENAIVASICPKIYEGSSTDPSYGYNPVVNAVIQRLKEQLPPGN